LHSYLTLASIEVQVHLCLHKRKRSQKSIWWLRAET